MNNTEKLNKILPNHSRYISGPTVERIFQSDYNVQAINFLLETETTCEIHFLGLSTPTWGKQPVNQYSVILKNKRHSYGFHFYDSISNTEKGKKSTYDFYSVLACMNVNNPQSFDEFCSEFGYEFKNETEYIKAKQTHLAVLDEEKNLRKLFNEQELEKLSEIN